MSARREKRLRKMEAKVTYMDGRVRELERRLLPLEELATQPIFISSAGAKKPKARTFIERLKTWRTIRKMKRAYMRPDVTPEEVKAAFNSWKTK